MDRVSVVGSSGSGKTTVSRALASALGVPVLELDAVFHQPGWTPRPDPEFQDMVRSFVAGDRWVVDGNYSGHGMGDIVWPRADTIVWLDPPRRVVMRRVVIRTLRRVATREVLWNGNREPWSNLYSLDPAKNIITWAWTRFERMRDRYERMMADGTWSHAEVIRVRTGPEWRRLRARVGA